MSYKFRIGLVWSALFILAGCSHDDGINSNKNAIFTLHVADDYRADFEYWIIIHNQDGAVLDYRQYKAGDNITLTTDKETPGDVISVTLLESSTMGGTQEGFYLSTVTGVPVGNELTLPTNNGDFTSPVEAGTFYVKLNSSDFIDWKISSVKNICDFANEFSNGDLTISAHLYVNQNRYMVAVQDAQHNLKYKFLENIVDQEVIDLDLTDFQSFDKTVTFHFPTSTGFSLFASGQESVSTDPGFTTQQHVGIDDGPVDQVTIGYLNSLPYTSTSLNVYGSQVNYSYWKLGAPPTGDVTIPSLNPPTIQNNTLQSFQITPVDPFKSRASRWQIDKSTSTFIRYTTWDVYSADNSQKIIDFPDEILTRFPNLEVSTLEYAGSNYIFQSRPFEESKDEFLRTGRFSNGEDYYSASVQP